MSLIENERTKLTATAVNNLALAFAVAGFVAPLVGYSFGLSTAPNVTTTTSAISLTWFTTGIILHGVGRWILRLLEP